MRKLLLFLACLGLVLPMAGCGNEEESAEYIEESAGKMEKKITSGQFVVDGHVYSFPMQLSEWLDNGWHVSNNYSNKDSFKLESGYESNEFELFNEDGDYVEVIVLNITKDALPIEDCFVTTLTIKADEVNPVFPSGMTKESELEELEEAWGKADEKDKDENTGFVDLYYGFEGTDKWQCAALVSVEGDTLEEVKYDILDTDANANKLVFGEGVSVTCEKYVDLAMKASFYGDFTEYIAEGFDTQQGAEALYVGEMEYYAEYLMAYAELNSAMISEDYYTRFVAVAEEVLAQTKWEIKEIKLNDDETEGTIDIALYPTDYLYIIQDPILEAIEEYNTKYANVDFESLTNSEKYDMEDDYAEMVLSRIESLTSQIKLLDGVEKTYNLDIAGSIISSEDWSEIDSIIMDEVVEE